MDLLSLSSKLLDISSPGETTEKNLQSPVERRAPSSRRNSTEDVTFGQDYDFVEPPPRDFFCPVTLELLVDPHQTKCCGNHISVVAAAKLQNEAKPCPVCNEPNFETVPDKHYRRRVLELRVNCPHAGCDWVGEVRGYKAHSEACLKRSWDCMYCGLNCTFDEGESVHWPQCKQFPEPCPNRCEVQSVPRQDIEQHRTVCSLEPVACKMSEFGCQAVVPRKDIVEHVKENEGQHLMLLAILNHQNYTQLQSGVTELQQSLQHLQQSIHRMHMELTTLKAKVQHIESHAAGGDCNSCTVHTFPNYSQLKSSERDCDSKPFFSSANRGYKFNFRIRCYRPPYDMIVIFLGLLPSEYDEELNWPIKVSLQVEQLNQIGERGHRRFTSILDWNKDERGVWRSIDSYQMKYGALESKKQNVQYLLNDTIMYRLHLKILSTT